MAEASATNAFVARLSRAFDIATIVVAALWQIAAAGTALLVYFDRYTAPAVAVAVWLAQLLIIAAGAVLLLRRRDDVRAIWLLAAADLAAGVALLSVCPPGELLRINWAWATTGLIAVLLLLHRPVRELAGFIVVNAGTVLVALLDSGTLDRHDLAGFITLLYASASIQLTMLGGARVFQFTARLAADAAAEQWEITAQQAVIAEVVQARRRRYEAAREFIVPLLSGLADGSLDPGDPGVRHRCAAAEARLRQLMARQEDIPHPLVQVLQEGIDDAVRRGVVVDATPAGSLPPMTDSAARMLAETPLAALATTRDYARLTVVATEPGRVSVSILTDGTAPEASPVSGVSITTDQDGDLSWVEARWQSSP